MSIWQLSVRSLTGRPFHVQVRSTATGLDVKNAIQRQDPTLLPHLQRLIGPSRNKLSDNSKLSEGGISHGSILNLVILPPFNIHIQGVDGRMYTVIVPSSEPEMYTIAALCVLVERAVGHSMGEYQMHHQGRPVDGRRHGKEMLLSNYSIKREDTLVLMKMGLVLDITNPKVDVCFLVDCTGSMANWIEAVKNNIQQLQDRLVAEYRECDLLFAFVRYTDYDQPQSTRTSCLPFTNDAASFRNFVGAIRANGGGDGPEDIMGGFNVTFRGLCWRSDACKILIHIADAPCHGTKYHTSHDSYPNGDPAGMSHEAMMGLVAELDIQYWFGYIVKSSTDQMIRIFNDSLRVLSKQRLLIRQFDAIHSSEVGEAVERAVISSVCGSSALKKAALYSFTLDSNVPDWNSPTISQLIAKKTPSPAIRRLSDLQRSGLVLEKPSINFTFKIAPNPFAEGSECLVYHASDLVNFQRVVMKRFKRSGMEYNTLESYMKELEVRVIASVYAREFSMEKLKPPNTPCIDFTPLDIVQCDGGIFLMLEQFLGGKIKKFNNNSGVVAKSSALSDLLQAFSHYSWIKSGKTLLICDLQGFEDSLGHSVILTDPAIHSNLSAGRFGAMDGGMTGVVAFFQTHTCTAVCTQMNLKGQYI